MKNHYFKNVGELIDFLEPHRHRQLIIDDDGNTDGVLRNHFYLWDENDPESPIAIIPQLVFGD